MTHNDADTHTHTHTLSFQPIQSFQGQFGRAYLLASVINVYESTLAEDRSMATGVHRVRNVHCTRCERVLGWRYERASDPTQQYKEGKYVLEVSRLAMDVGRNGGDE